MEGLSKDLVETTKLILFQKPKYCTLYSSLILFSNENISSKNKILKYKDKTVLSPIGSGDQYLGAKYYGAKRVINYDINHLSKYMLDLKIGAIKTLTQRDFKKFLFPRLDGTLNEQFLNLNYLDAIENNLDDNTHHYWRSVLEYAKEKEVSGLIEVESDDYNQKNIEEGSPFYKKESAYKKLQNILLLESNIEIIIEDITNIMLSENVDIIDLSNIIKNIILDLMYEKEVDDNLLDIISYTTDFIEENLIDKLNESGIILLDYSTNIDENGYFDIFNGYNKHKVKSKKLSKTDIITTKRK